GPGHTPRMFDWQDPIGIALDMADVVGAELEVRQGSHQAFHPGRTAELVLEDQIIGYAGELLPKLLEDLDLPQRTAALELDLDAFVAAAPLLLAATRVAASPATYQDGALVADHDIAASSVPRTLQKAVGALLEQLGLFAVHAGQGLAEG